MTKQEALALIASYTSQAALAMQNAKNIAEAHDIPFNVAAYDALNNSISNIDWDDSGCSIEDNWNSSDRCW